MVPCSAGINTHSDIRGLLLHQHLNIHVRRVAEAFPADPVKDLIDQCLVIRFMLAGKLPGNNQVIILQEALHSNAGIRIMLQAVGDDGIADLIADFIRVSIRHLLTGKNSHYIRPS